MFRLYKSRGTTDAYDEEAETVSSSPPASPVLAPTVAVSPCKDSDSPPTESELRSKEEELARLEAMLAAEEKLVGKLSLAN